MRWKSLSKFLIIGVLLLVSSCSKKSIFEEHPSVFQIGDQPEWAAKDMDDQYWRKRKPIVWGGEIYWSRTPITILKSPESMQPYGILLEVYGEYEVFWDGVLIGKNGNPGQETELPPEGKLWRTFSIPEQLTEAGEHTLAIRSSLYYFPDHSGIWKLTLDQYDTLLNDQLLESTYMHLFAGAFLIAAIYFLFLFLSDKKEYATLIFSISCLLFFALILAEFSKAYIPIHYNMHVVRLRIISLLMLCISFSVPLYFSMQFPYPKRGWCLTVFAGLLLFFFFSRYVHPLTPNNMIFSMWVFSFVIVTLGAYKKMKGARLVLLTLLISLPIGWVTTFNKSLFASFSLILLGMFYLLSLRIKEQRLAYENSLVQSTRLRLELLKKNIQPHFLMNTLTSLIDWIEETPKKGVLFIEALAKEFDLFNQIENQTLIPITQEIVLCRTHIEIMEYRKEIRYSLEEKGIDPEQKIPPGILHTLLENGITHSLPLEDNTIKFKLLFESNSDYKCYTFLTFAKAVGQQTDTTKEGTGLKYIKARLSESYQDQWELSSEPVSHGWKNTIKIYV
ncbi:MAG: histidine kinase [Flavobacteriaceae bacterium]